MQYTKVEIPTSYYQDKNYLFLCSTIQFIRKCLKEKYNIVIKGKWKCGNKEYEIQFRKNI